ncbi:MAG: hypothetical protein C4K49_00445 [Candidatus Thorarchaeota archaeon]|nr:MAG: hypothetical protein C4K49_00445 [Candidatus Thorarchaeota archaeon]
MIRRHFVVAFRKLEADQTRVSSGSNSPEMVTACRCVNVSLFLSDGIRKDVQTSLLVGDETDLHVISFPGDKMKRVSPDERSISFFIMKGAEALKGIGRGTTRVLDNGITVSRTDLIHLFEQGPPGAIQVAAAGPDMLSDGGMFQTGIFVYDIRGTMSQYSGTRPVVLLPRPPNPERFILDVNLYCDGTEQNQEETSITPPRERYQ